MRLGRVSRQYHLMLATSLLSLALAISCASRSSAMLLIPLPLETSYGTAMLDFRSGQATVISGGDRITVGGVPLTSLGRSSASISWMFIDSLHVFVTHAGQSYQTCDLLPHLPCAYSFLFNLSMTALESPSPPGASGALSLTVPGTFGLTVAANVFLADPSQNFAFDIFLRSGPATITLDRSLESDWFFESGFAEFEPTPEPATLLFLGTTATGLGVAAWRRRRRT